MFAPSVPWRVINLQRSRGVDPAGAIHGMVDDTDTVGCRVSAAFLHVRPQNGVVDGVYVGRHGVPALGVIVRLVETET